jgi:hypothetical protein
MYKITPVKELLIPGGGKYNYSHISDPLTQFRYPIPICGPTDAAIIPPMHRFISCKTQTATLRKSESRTDQENWTYLGLQDDGGVFLGALDVHEIDAELASEYDLISISEGMRGSAHGLGPPGWRDEERQITGLVCEYYNVLWIEWDDDHRVAFRKGVGWILKDAYETLDLKWVDVTFG